MSSEEQLQALPTFRRLAFEEIHAAGHWGRGLSGGGSNAEVTKPLARHLLKFLKEQGAKGKKGKVKWISSRFESFRVVLSVFALFLTSFEVTCESLFEVRFSLREARSP